MTEQQEVLIDYLKSAKMDKQFILLIMSMLETQKQQQAMVDYLASQYKLTKKLPTQEQPILKKATEIISYEDYL